MSNILGPLCVGFGTSAVAGQLGFPITHIAYWLIFAAGMAVYLGVKYSR